MDDIANGIKSVDPVHLMTIETQPPNTVVTAGYGAGDALTVTSGTRDGQTVLAYIPNGNATTLTVAMDKITSASHAAKCWWFNPSSGTTTFIGSYVIPEQRTLRRRIQGIGYWS